MRPRSSRQTRSPRSASSAHASTHARLDGAPVPSDVRKKLGHYRASLRMLEQVLDGHSLVWKLRFELEAFRAFPPGRPLRPVAHGGPA